MLMQSTNATNICLNPEKTDILSLKDTRPTSLVSCLYKLMVEVLHVALREVLCDTVDGTRGAFVNGDDLTLAL